MAQQWQTPLLGCCSEGIGTCIKGCLCGCIMGGETTAKLEGGGCMVPCILYTLCRPCYSLHRRGAVRAAYKIDGSCIGDCLTCLFCNPCSIIQESVETEKRGSPSGPVGQSMAR